MSVLKSDTPRLPLKEIITYGSRYNLLGCKCDGNIIGKLINKIENGKILCEHGNNFEASTFVIFFFLEYACEGNTVF